MAGWEKQSKAPQFKQLMGMQAGVLYGYKIAGDGGWETGHRWQPNKVLADPYAPLLKGRARWGQRDTFENFTRVGQLALPSSEVALSCCSCSCFMTCFAMIAVKAQASETEARTC